jgi:hypothetical protein
MAVIPPMAVQAQVVQSSNQRQQVEQIIGRIKTRHAIELVFENVRGQPLKDVIFEEISYREYKRLAAFLKVFEEELGKYPQGYFKEAALAKVIFVKKLFFEGEPAQGIYLYPQSLMFFDIYRDFGNKLSQRHSIHHEIFHMVDTSLRRAGLLWSGEAATGDFYGWAGLNDPSFKYEKVGRWHKGRNELNFLAPPKAGFATDYGFISMAEDMAEVYACLFVESESRLLHQWAQKDAILKAKIAAMKTILEKFSPQVNSRFWEELF